MTISMNDDEPKGKRSVRRTVRGSLCGYIGGKFWINFGEWDVEYVQRTAEEWKLGEVK